MDPKTVEEVEALINEALKDQCTDIDKIAFDIYAKVLLGEDDELQSIQE